MNAPTDIGATAATPRPPQITAAEARLAQAILLVGNPNVGKTTLFNQLTGLRAKTSNFPGTTLEIRSGTWRLAAGNHEVIDMPGLYSLNAVSAEERDALNTITQHSNGAKGAALVVLVLDATHLERNLYLAGQVLALGVPVVVVLNMIDIVDRSDVKLDVETLESHLNCPVVAVSSRSGRGIDQLTEICADTLEKSLPREAPKLLQRLNGTSNEEHLARWAQTVSEASLSQPAKSVDPLTEKVDRVLIHPIGGLVAFLSILFAVFYLIFSFAAIPMDFIDATIGGFGAWVGGLLPDGKLNSLIVDGVIAGVGGVVIFLPQICILFFCIALLEDTGYLARAAAGMDRLFRRVGLPGKAFVPFLSAHACAIPAIMATRVLEDKRDRLIAILVLPLCTCSARLPVYAMVTAMLFPGQGAMAALLFTGAYALGITAALSMAWILRRSIVKAPPAPLLIELPSYRIPSLKTALLAAYDRGLVFVRKAGTVILAISIVLWWMMNYPTVEVPPAPATAELDAASYEAQEQLAGSFAGRLGHAIEPVIEPLGFDWKIGVALVASFAAREVVVSALSVIYGVGDEGADGGSVLIDRLHAAERPDGSKVFNTATAVSLLVFFVLAMQCLPTQAVTRRETGKWRWAGFQLGYMTCLAYVASLIAYQSLTALGVS